MSQYHIYQTENAPYVFMKWSLAKDRFSFADYKKLYSGELVESILYKGQETIINQKDEQVLDELFIMFNKNKPADFYGHSLSVSDVVEIVRNGKSKFYYCDRLGWQSITIKEGKE